MNIELHLDEDPPYVICFVGDPIAVEHFLEPHGVCVGNNWWSTHPDQEQADGRWKMFVEPLSEYEDEYTEETLA